jgi:RNA recognition motif-containing protein
VHDLRRAGKPRGYAFIEFEHKNDMKSAYKMADGRKIEGRRILVDVERGRTVPNWSAALFPVSMPDASLRMQASFLVPGQ